MVLAFRFFFVIGPVFAFWAVVLAFIGFTRPQFPRNLGAQRLVIGISLSFMLTVVLAANLFADGVRDAFDPRARAFRPRLAITRRPAAQK